MQQGRFRATGMMNHHPQAPRRSSVAILVTGQVGHFWKAHPGLILESAEVIFELRQLRRLSSCIIRSSFSGLDGLRKRPAKKCRKSIFDKRFNACKLSYERGCQDKNPPLLP
jgi:hypothetical protein